MPSMLPRMSPSYRRETCPGFAPPPHSRYGRARRSSGSRTAAGVPTVSGKIPGRSASRENWSDRPHNPAHRHPASRRPVAAPRCESCANIPRRAKNAEGVGERSEARTQAAVGPPVARRGMAPPSVPSARPTRGRTSGCSNLGLADALYSRSTRFQLPRPRRDRPCDEIGSVEEVIDTVSKTSRRRINASSSASPSSRVSSSLLPS